MYHVMSRESWQEDMLLDDVEPYEYERVQVNQPRILRAAAERARRHRHRILHPHLTDLDGHTHERAPGFGTLDFTPLNLTVQFPHSIIKNSVSKTVKQILTTIYIS